MNTKNPHQTTKVWIPNRKKNPKPKSGSLPIANFPAAAKESINHEPAITHQSPNFVQSFSKNYSNWKKSFYHKEWFRNINYKLLAIKANHTIAYSLIVSLVMFFGYLAFFDQNFIIREYSIKFQNESYLNQSQVKRLANYFHRQKLYGIFPNNQYWFLNSVNLTASAQEVFPEIKQVSLIKKTWPNQVDLLVEINPILVTLAVKENNEQKYWRISSSGSVLSEDKAGIWENLVTVEKPYFLINQNASQDSKKPQVNSSNSSEPQTKLSLQNYSFSKDKIQLKKLQATTQIWKTLKNLGITVISTEYPSISDSDIIIKTDKGTRLFFDSQEFPISLQNKRIVEFFGSNIDKQTVKESHSQSKFTYLDFRIQKRIYFCKVTEQCTKE